MSEKPSAWRTLLGGIPQSEPHQPNVVPMRRRTWPELEREVVEASAAFSRIVDEGDRIEKAYTAERERLAGEAKEAAERVMAARQRFADRCAEIGAKVDFVDEIVEDSSGTSSSNARGAMDESGHRV